MELEHLIEAIEAYNDNLVQFNNGEAVHCFLYHNTWYPLRATINYASDLANERNDFTKNEAINEIHKLLPYVAIQKVNIEDGNLPELTNQQKQNRIKDLAKLITTLVE
ncbi:hypothetical protein [Winogradskyella pulchriflava]|uniref:Uncharacterized protein n=1 Tax=Winogradskyella pulchriflava TaxID=1110688 RepID=A0ABV6Q9K4_9FLAO